MKKLLFIFRLMLLTFFAVELVNCDSFGLGLNLLRLLWFCAILETRYISLIFIVRCQRMGKCNKCKVSWWGNDLTKDGVCGICIRSDAPNRSPLVVFGIFHSGRCSLAAEKATLVLTELKAEETGKIAIIPIANIQEFAITPPQMAFSRKNYDKNGGHRI